MSKKKIKVGIIAAEHSGDRLGSKLIKSLENNFKVNIQNNVNKDTTNRLNHGNAKNFNNYENINIKTNECDRNNNRMWVPTDAPKIPQSSNYYGNLNTMPQQYDENTINQRIAPDILTAFKNNPYTQSLSSIA